MKTKPFLARVKKKLWAFWVAVSIWLVPLLFAITAFLALILNEEPINRWWAC